MSKGSMEILKQTNRTILFEQFSDPEKNSINLYDLLLRVKNKNERGVSGDTEFFEEIKEYLEVFSFKDFLHKFPQTVYEYIQMDERSNTAIFSYTTNEKEAIDKSAKEIKITDHAFFKMLCDLYKQKGDSNKTNIEFDATRIREILTPSQEKKEACDMRRQMQLMAQEYDKRKERHESVEDCIQEYNEFRLRLAEKYKGFTLSTLSIAIDDVDRKLEQIEKNIGQLGQSTTDDAHQLAITTGRYTFNNEGELVFEALPQSSEKDSPDDGGQSILPALIEQVGHDYDEMSGSDANPFIRDLVLCAYTPKSTLDREDGVTTVSLPALIEKKEKLSLRKERMENVYVQARESFIEALSTSVQKLLDVMVFFDHATVEGGVHGELPRPGGLIVANCTADRLLESSVRETFEKYMMRLGTGEAKNGSKIWFAILPQVSDGATTVGNEAGASITIPITQLKKAQKTGKTSRGLDYESAVSVMKILEKSKILTVFSLKASEKTSFRGISAKFVRDMQGKLEKSFEDGGSHVVYAYPSFSLMPGGDIPLSEQQEAPTIKVPDVYVDAAYVAAGLLVASQQPEFLKRNGFRGQINDKNVCVHVNLESDAVANHLQTHCNRELSYSWNPELIKAINQKKFGFVFSSDVKYDRESKQAITHAYVLYARTMARKEGAFQPIFWTLTKNFCKTYLEASCVKLTPTDVRDFFDKEVNNWNLDKKEQTLNRILYENESVRLDGQHILFQFGKDEELIDVEVDGTDQDIAQE
ncbi:MAG: hypothetical protein IJU76_15355 [Desulfovibrionaceae bacterium]|nr:hypothetical protein [Desulfovibrionaceae bacterium]